MDITKKEFSQIQKVMYELAGISIAESKTYLIQSRLQKRLLELKMKNISDYLQYMLTLPDVNTEISKLINMLTTNETSFFREERHFDYLSQTVLPEFVNNGRVEKIRIWSSACSTGQEPYSIAMIMEDFIFKTRAKIKYEILATDINTEVLKVAAKGLYRESDFKDKIDSRRLSKYFEKVDSETFGISNGLRNNVVFKQLNLKEDRFPLKAPLDIIFCRNVMIYFPPDIRNLVVRKFYESLKSDGLLFIGHSENIFSQSELFKLEKNTIYRKK